ncbi:FUSC family protein [Salinisphaera sp. Q1T1-3]|uniref:FUSC family protein n=1 Tax=Salinisphaera sp. Q1T1-3 TaxID=2321229 RepID=UPI000E76E92D|nr:FUSC family protein [Salinisphaera sp. Q1T1-3]RJS93265.1 FUSC family protein [Salinisphaera sp. Q1T1-3]
MSRLSWLFLPSADSVGFALRFCLAIALALFLSMWLELDRPYWAALEVAVMMQPLPGLAVVRGFARAAGTLVAGCVGLLILALFYQSYELSAAALVIWITFCAFCSNLLRNNLSYGFAIAGFIAGVTVILSHTLDQPPFEIAVARTSECVLAAIVTAAVNVLFSPPKTARSYRESRLRLLGALGGEFVRLAGLGGSPTAEQGETAQGTDDDPHPVLQDLAAQALALEQTRQYISYEYPGFAHLNRMARRLDYDILALVSAASSLHVYLAARPGQPDTTPLQALAEPARRLQDAPTDWARARQAFDAAYDAIIDNARRPASHGRPRTLADWVVISRALDLADRGRAALIKHGMLLTESLTAEDGANDGSEFGHPMDIRNALRNAARTLVAVSLGGMVWINFHDQLPAILLMILLAALTTIFATLPNPVAAAGGFGKGLAIAAIAAFVVDFLLLPQANSYAMLMLCTLPFYFAAGLAMTVPNIAVALPGRISAVMFSLLVHVQSGALPSFTTYFQIALGISGAVGLTILAFRLVLPVTARQRLREQMHGVFDEMAGGDRRTRARFETRMYDRLNSLALNDVEDGPVTFSPRQAVLASINIGLEARTLVVLSQRLNLDADLHGAIEAEMTRLRAQFAGRSPALETVMDAQRNTHALAQRVIEHAVGIEEIAERRQAIRAAVSAELMASALADYMQAFQSVDHSAIALGERPSSQQAD